MRVILSTLYAYACQACTEYSYLCAKVTGVPSVLPSTFTGRSIRLIWPPNIIYMYRIVERIFKTLQCQTIASMSVRKHASIINSYNSSFLFNAFLVAMQHIILTLGRPDLKYLTVQCLFIPL